MSEGMMFPKGKRKKKESGTTQASFSAKTGHAIYA